MNEVTEATSFSLSCDVTGFKDSTWFYIQNNPGTVVDSAMTVDGRCTFNKFKSEDGFPELAIFLTRNGGQAVVLWVENAAMTMKIEKGKFQHAIVAGSKTQSDWAEINNLTIPLYRKRDSISTLADDPNIPAGRKKELESLKQRLIDAVRKEQISFVTNHPASFISAYLLDLYSGFWGKKVISGLFDSLTDDMKNSRYGKNVREFILVNKDPKIGDKFADIEQPDVDGVNKRLSDFKGKVILLEFWAGWCGPCRKENPELKTIYSTFNKKGFEIYAVSLDFKKEQWKKAIEDDGLPWTQVSVLKGFKNTAALTYGIDAIPDNFLIDREGTIVARNLHGAELTKKLEELLH
jgi:peroxiredoxin